MEERVEDGMGIIRKYLNKKKAQARLHTGVRCE